MAYVKEYGTDEFDIQVGAVKAGQNVVMVDDLLATVRVSKCFFWQIFFAFARNLAQLTGLESLVARAGRNISRRAAAARARWRARGRLPVRD